MNVLYNTYPVAFAIPGGGEIQMLQYKKYLEKSGLSIDFYNQWNPDFDKYDAVHFFSCLPGSEHFLRFIQSYQIPIIVSPNLWITSQNKSEYPLDVIKVQLDIANFIVCNSVAERQTLSNIFDVDPKKIIIVYNGISEIFFIKTNEKIFRETYCNGFKYILNVANIEPRKNQINLMHALKNFPEYKLVVMGNIRDHDYANRLRYIGGSQLIVADYETHGSLMQRSAYAGCELFALPSVLETPGLASLEAAACGAKILVTKEGSAYEYFGATATYANPNSVEELSDGIGQALASITPSISDEMRKRFSWSEVLHPLEDIYKNIIEKH